MIKNFKSRRFLLYAGVMVWAIAFNVYLYLYHSDNISEAITKLIETSKNPQRLGAGTGGNVWDVFEDQADLQNYRNHYKPVDASILDSSPIKLYSMKYVNDIRDIATSFSSNYEDMLLNPDGGDSTSNIISVLNLDFPHRCLSYFQNLYANNHNWIINPNENLPLRRHGLDFGSYRHNRYGDLQREYKERHKINNDDPITDNDDFEKFVHLKYDGFWNETLNYEQTMVDSLSHLRIFNKCYITANEVNQQREVKNFVNEQTHFIKSINDLHFEESSATTSNNHKAIKAASTHFNPENDCTDLEQRLYPWLSFHFPIFEKYTGAFELTPPKFKNSNAKKIDPLASGSSSSCFFNKFKNTLSGKGIVFSIGDQHVDDTVNLISLLRAHYNTLPIQIVYYDNLSGHSKMRIVKAAREELKALPESFEQVRHLFPEDYDRGLPPQEVYFVNTYNVIHENFRGKFDRFGNKLLATVFNSFEEFILIDADSVLLKSPDWFFENEKYKKSGAFFFKDRAASEFRPDSDSYFFKKMTPNPLDSVLFNFPLITEKTLEMEAMAGMFHHMEAGVVVIDKLKHYGSILLLPQINFMEPFRGRSHGEKEFFWLSFLINGDEGFEFNSYHAAAAGQFRNQRIKGNGEPQSSPEICSAHPAHVDDQTNELIWFNSGFHLCGQLDRVNYGMDLQRQDGRYGDGLNTEEDLVSYYFGPLQLQNVVIPPFKNKLETYCPNNAQEPARAWERVDLCNGYLWCAYGSIGAGDNLQNGTIISIDEQSQKLFRYYGDIWIGNE